MRDLDLSNRDLYGNVSFKIKSNSISGIENLIQKITTLLLSSTKTTYFGEIAGSDVLSAGKFNFSTDSTLDYKLMITDNILNISKKIKNDENKYNIPSADRLKNIEIKDIVFDKTNLNVYLSLIISTNSATKIIQLPVKS